VHQGRGFGGAMDPSRFNRVRWVRNSPKGCLSRVGSECSAAVALTRAHPAEVYKDRRPLLPNGASALCEAGEHLMEMS